MASITSSDILSKNVGLKALSLLAALIIWLIVNFGRDESRSENIRLELRNMPSGLTITSELPRTVDVTLSGPRFSLLGLRPGKYCLVLDFAGVKEGVVAFPSLEKLVEIPTGIHVTRIQPASLELHVGRVLTRQEQNPAHSVWRGSQ